MGRGNVRTFFPMPSLGRDNQRLSTDSTESNTKENTVMLIKRSACPVSARGRQGSGLPVVAIRENGQLAFNTKAWEHFPAGVKYLAVGLDENTRAMTVQGLVTVPAKMTEGDLFPCKPNMKDDKETGGGYAAFAAALKLDVINYDYKTSGNQTFETTLGKPGILSFVLPSGSLEAKPKVPRKKKAEKTATATATATPATSGHTPLLDVD